MTKRKILRGATVYDGTGSPPSRLDIAIEGERISELGTSLTGGDVVDLRGASIIPGLIDCHVHVSMENADLTRWLAQPFSYQFFLAAQNLRKTLHAGVTTVRDAGGADLGIKRAVEDGLIEGPRMQIAINMISQTGGHGDEWNPSGVTAGFFAEHPGRPAAIADGEAEARKVARLMLRAGADVLKIASTGGVLSPADDPRHSEFSTKEIITFVEEARAAGASVMSHAQGSNGIKNAIRAGVRSIEHGVFLDDEAIDLMLEYDVWLVPTLKAPLDVLSAAERGISIEASQLDKCSMLIDAHRESFARAIKAGVRIAMGTDSGLVGHGENLGELALMREYGMAPAEVLRAATSSAAELLGAEHDIGTIAPGRYADLLVVRAGSDPYDFDELPQAISQVWKAGAPAWTNPSGV